MASREKTLIEYEVLLDKAEGKLILQQEKVLAFLGSPHSSNDNLNIQALVRKSHKDVNAIYTAFLKNKNASEEFRAAAKDMGQRCRDLRSYTWEMGNALANDYAIRHAIEDRAKVDVVKNTSFLLAATGGCIAAVKAGVGNGIVSVTQAAAVGMGAGGGVLARKKIAKACVTAGKSICHRINTDPTLIYLEQITREKLRTVSRVMKLAR